jgi:hypothetical protein
MVMYFRALPVILVSPYSYDQIVVHYSDIHVQRSLRFF